MALATAFGSLLSNQAQIRESKWLLRDDERACIEPQAGRPLQSFATKLAIAGALKRNTPIPPMLGFASTPMIGSGDQMINTDGASTRVAGIGGRMAFGSGVLVILTRTKGVGFGRRSFRCDRRIRRAKVRCLERRRLRSGRAGVSSCHSFFRLPLLPRLRRALIVVAEFLSLSSLCVT